MPEHDLKKAKAVPSARSASTFAIIVPKQSKKPGAGSLPFSVLASPI